MHYQIHPKGKNEVTLVEADSIDNSNALFVFYKLNDVVAVIPAAEVSLIVEVEASSVPPRDVFLDQQTALQKLRVEHKALQLKNNELWSDRRKAIDEQADMSAELHKEKKSHKRTCWVLAFVCTVEVILAISRALH